MYSQMSVWLKGSPSMVSSSTYGTVIAANTVTWPIGSGMGSLKSYSLYSRFSIRQMLV
jgi:hypothetical protein